MADYAKDNDFELAEDLHDFLPNVALGDVLTFITGFDQLPVIRLYPRPHVTFDHTDERVFPWASTCLNGLTLFINSRNECPYEFMFNMSMALMHGEIFSDT
jgi:hypothetical protein